MSERKQSAYAPGRVELLGNHTDYNEGVVLAAALDLGAMIEGVKCDDGILRLASDAYEHVVEVAVQELRKGEEAPWADYLIGVVKVMRDAGYEVGGFDASLTSSVPLGAGLSSSAAIEVATATLCCKLFGLSIAPMELAKLCRKAENEFVGVNCGLLDQATSVFGRAGHAVMLDCREESVRQIPMPEGVALLIVNSNVKHELTGGEYNERREACFAAARALGVRALRDVTPVMLEEEAHRLEPIALRRARHVVGECDRVRRGIVFLESGDAAAFGELMFESHESSIDNFENSTPELDLLVEIARETPGVFGCRLSGGGFGGATVSLVAEDAVDAASERIVEEYFTRAGIQAVALRCHAADGAR